MISLDLITIIYSVCRPLFYIGPIIILVAFLVYAERKIIAACQLRIGPDVVGPLGILQSFADAVKGMAKESILPTAANKPMFLLAPLLTFGLAMAGWVCIPITPTLNYVNFNFGALYIMAISGIAVYGIILAGWSSNSKYAFYGAIRSASQMISYEIAIGFGILTIGVLTESLNFKSIVEAQKTVWFALPLLPVFVMFFISILAETNRHPFDLPEAESELVSGYHVEYSSMPFTLFFLGEYANMILMSSVCVILFLGGWLPPFSWSFFDYIPPFIWFSLKVCLMLYLFIIIRAALPRYRYDQLIRLGWKIFLPFSLICFFITAAVKFFYL